MAKQSRPKPSRGIALAVTMMMVAVLTLLVGALFEVYRSHYSLTRSSAASESAAAGCDAVYNYICYRLEHERDWGAELFGAGSDSDPGGNLTITQVPNSHRFTGTIPALDVEFEGEVLNNLVGSTDPAVNGPVTAGRALCRVRCTSSQASRQAEFLVQVAPLFDSSVLTRADLNVRANVLEMRSMDENRNMLRAEGDIYVPNVLTAQNSQFLLPGGSTAPDSKGMLWSKKNIFSYDPGLVTSEAIDDVDELRDATNNSHGKVVPLADAHFSIYDMEEGDIKVSSTHTDITMPPGRYNFVRRQADVTYTAQYQDSMDFLELSDDTSTLSNTATVWVDVMEYYADPSDPTPTSVWRATHHNDDLLTQVPTTTGGSDPLNLVPSTIAVNVVDVTGYGTPVTLLESGILSYGKASFDLNNQSFNADADATINVDGQFHITSETQLGAPTETPAPTLNLGYNAGYVGGAPDRAAIIARDTINIEDGITNGLGALISRQGDVRIQPKNTSAIIAEAPASQPGLVIFAGNNVILKNPNGSSDWDFRGLVYARQGIKMEGVHAERATFEGSIVALQETPPAPGEPNGIEFDNCDAIEFIYNDKLLDAFVKSLPDKRIQVELVYWKA